MQLGFVTIQEDNEQSNDINVSREIEKRIKHEEQCNE
jgi:hypothetical protein